MTAVLRIERAGPLTTIQDDGRFGVLSHGVSASGPMDRGAYRRAGQRAGAADGAAIEFTQAGIDLSVAEGEVRLGWDGGQFEARINGTSVGWPDSATLEAGDRVSVTPGASGNYGYVRFSRDLQLEPIMGSRATSTRARLGGVEGRALRNGDVLQLGNLRGQPVEVERGPVADGPIRFVWGLHAERFPRDIRERFDGAIFRITTAMDRMGVRLTDTTSMFAGTSILSLVSDPVLAGDIQILGDGTPIVLMRDHQPTGGYPRIGTIITADLDRFAQLRAGETVMFTPVTVEHAHQLLRSRK